MRLSKHLNDVYLGDKVRVWNKLQEDPKEQERLLTSAEMERFDVEELNHQEIEAFLENYQDYGTKKTFLLIYPFL